MDRVGGFASFRALVRDEDALEDVLLAMAGEAEARRIAAMQAGA